LPGFWSFAGPAFERPGILHSAGSAQRHPQVLVIPAQLIAVTDSRNYKDLTENLYRFQPTWISSMAGARRIHGIEERISIENLGEHVQFYRQLILNSAAAREDFHD
jgi:acetylornithine deacetylase/succinyl-diaminopimelate desuccinylase-like protein